MLEGVSAFVYLFVCTFVILFLFAVGKVARSEVSQRRISVPHVTAFANTRRNNRDSRFFFSFLYILKKTKNSCGIVSIGDICGKNVN